MTGLCDFPPEGLERLGLLLVARLRLIQRGQERRIPLRLGFRPPPPAQGRPALVGASLLAPAKWPLAGGKQTGGSLPQAAWRAHVRLLAILLDVGRAPHDDDRCSSVRPGL